MSSFLSLQNKNVIITGGTSNIALQTANLLLQYGANVILLSRNLEKLEEYRKNNNTDKLHVYKFDINDDIKTQLTEILDNFKKIHGFIHNAGIEIIKPLNLITYDDFEKINKINVYAAIEIIKLISNNKYIENSASYILISSIVANLSDKLFMLYSLTKKSLSSIARSLALELSHKNVRINAILPSYVKDTTMFNNYMGKINTDLQENLEKKHLLGFLEPIDIAYACLFLLTDMGRKITGTEFIIDSGYSLV